MLKVDNTYQRVEGSNTRSNTEVVDEDYDDAGSRSNGSVASPNLSAKSPPSQDLPPTSLLERIKFLVMFNMI